MHHAGLIPGTTLIKLRTFNSKKKAWAFEKVDAAVKVN
jgi:hypothetical protein